MHYHTQNIFKTVFVLPNLTLWFS